MPIYIGGSAPKNIYVGTTAVKKVYCGTQLVWSKDPVTGTFGSSTHDFTFADNGRGHQYAFRFTVTVTSKDYINKQMTVNVAFDIRSINGYNISSSASKTASITIDGTSVTSGSYTGSVSAGGSAYCSSASRTITRKSSITISASIPLNVTITDGVGWVGTVSVPGWTYTMPAF